MAKAEGSKASRRGFDTRPRNLTEANGRVCSSQAHTSLNLVIPPAPASRPPFQPTSSPSETCLCLEICVQIQESELQHHEEAEASPSVGQS